MKVLYGFNRIDNQHIPLSFEKGQRVKRIFDLITASILLLVLAPVMILIALAIKLDSRGTVIFKGSRVGKDGKEFYCYKFRSMVNNSAEILEAVLAEDVSIRKQWELYAKLKNDPRVTRVGRVIRKFSLDELPQIINVIKGDMSIVGPRPYLPQEKTRMSSYNDIFWVRPGITGYWQVNGRNNVEFVKRMEMELWYVKNWSLSLDSIILLRTVPAVLKAKGVY